MSEADVRTTLRVIAVLIAVMAAIDPAFPRIIASSRSVVAVRAAAGGEAAERALREALPGRTVIAREVINGRLPCSEDEDCVLMADGSREVDWDHRIRPISIFTVPTAGEPNVRLRSAVVSRGHQSAAGTARVGLEGKGVAGKRTALRVLDGPSVLGSRIHEWTKDDSAFLDVPWWPIEAGARALRIEAAPIDGEVSSIDNHIDIGVSVASGRIPVLVFDARPSWQSTFVRRALEDDPRFAIRYRSRLAPALSAGTAAGRLDAATLDEVPLVISGAPDALVADEVSLLERYVRVRGGTLLLLPDRRPSGPSERLFSGTWTEHLSPAPQSIGPLQASELLRLTNAAPAATVLAASGASPAIVSSPTGTGRIIVSGAMDAWRYRHLEAGAFDRFWRSLAAEGAAAGEGLTLMFATSLADRGARIPFTIHDRRMVPIATTHASVVQRCGNADAAAHAVRVWPGGAIGEFTGELAAIDRGVCTVEARVGDRLVSASIAVVDRAARALDPTLAKLERRARASGGAVATAGDEAAVARLLALDEPVSRDVTAHPMRSAWWMVPFAACLSIEWWLRRRNGLR